MKKRDMETRITAFSEKVARVCSMYDMQGLCMDQYQNYTIAVEAIDMEGEPEKSWELLFPSDELYIKCYFAEKVGAVFTLLVHVNNTIIVRQFFADHVNQIAKLKSSIVYTEAQFIAWWKIQKYGKQQKGYRPDMAATIANSYFDQLLERNGSSWSGNIDGYVVRRGSNNEAEIVALVECRYSNTLGIRQYDPNNYFKPYYGNGGDYNTWSGLKNIADKLGVPLLLFTYTRVKGQENYVGVTEIEDVTANGLVYKDNVRPCNHITNNPQSVYKWLEDNC